MEKTLEELETGLSTFLESLAKKRAAGASLRQQAADEEYQAALAAAQVAEKNTYLLESAAEKSRSAYQTYLQQQAARQAQLAKSGLRQDSASVQYLLKNSRFQALLDEKSLVNDMQTAVYENERQATEQIRALKASALAKRKAAHRSSWGWSLRSVVDNLLGGFY